MREFFAVLACSARVRNSRCPLLGRKPNVRPPRNICTSWFSPNQSLLPASNLKTDPCSSNHRSYGRPKSRCEAPYGGHEPSSSILLKGSGAGAPHPECHGRPQRSERAIEWLVRRMEVGGQLHYVTMPGKTKAS